MTGTPDLENQTFLSSVWQRELNLAIQSPRPQQRWVQRVRSVGRHDDLDIDSLVKAVHLVEKLHQYSLHLCTAATISTAPHAVRSRTPLLVWSIRDLCKQHHTGWVHDHMPCTSHGTRLWHLLEDIHADLPATWHPMAMVRECCSP